MIDILYVSFNRLAYTRQTTAALLAHTAWPLVARLFIWDDGSTDGTWEHLEDFATLVPVPVERRLGPGAQRGPVAAMNWYLDNRSVIACDNPSHVQDPAGCWRCGGTGHAHVETFAKVDNDFIVCPGWLTEMLKVMSHNPGLDVLGTEPMLGPSILGTARRGYEEATHIGGKGLIRSRIFDRCRPTPHGVNGYQGWTQYQHAHRDIARGWIRPELCTFGLDQLPGEPWQSLAAGYEELGWARRWPAYSADMDHYWDWWTPV